MANAMGGGGGTGGFRHLLEHLGPAIRGWKEDMQANTFSWSPDSLDKLTASVGNGIAGKDVSALETQRDEQLIKMLKMKGERRTSM
jgi:3-hydroxyacyl-CoA dehydrogenase